MMNIRDFALKYPEVKAMQDKLGPYEKNGCFPHGHFRAGIVERGLILEGFFEVQQQFQGALFCAF